MQNRDLGIEGIPGHPLPPGQHALEQCAEFLPIGVRKGKAPGGQERGKIGRASCRERV